MNPFPVIDALALPAPVWLFKLLHIALLGLHFAVVQYTLGALLVAGWWELRGKDANEPTRQGARLLARSLPTVMTFLINLGVPPLLFAQVLYGTSLYTSSTLIGAWWISVIGLLLLVYSLIYIGQFRAISGRNWAMQALAALLLMLVIGSIYSTNMTLMLRPERWAAMYQMNPRGTYLPFVETSVYARTMFIFFGGLLVGGLGLVMLGANPRRSPELRTLMLREGGLLAVVGALAQLPIGLTVLHSQSVEVQQALASSGLYHGGQLLWLLGWLLAIVVGLLAAVVGPKVAAAGGKLPGLAVVAPLVAVIATMAMTIVRDGIRDLNLKLAGFDVWSLPVHTNLPVLAIFLVLVVVALAIVGILVAVALKAQPLEEAPVR